MSLGLAPAVTRVLAERGQHVAEVTVFLDSGDETRFKGPVRRNRQEALKDCLELRKVAVRCTHDPSLYEVRQRKKELDSTTWTVKDLGGRMLDGAEGPPLGYTAPRSMAQESESKTAKRPGDKGPAGKFRGIVKGNAPSQECLVEVADVREAVPGAAKLGEEAWSARAKVALQQAFKRFGPVMEINMDVASGDDTGRIARVRFASAKAAEVCMTKALQGYLPVGSGQVRLRQPSAAEAVWRKFPPPRRADPALEGPNKKKLRPNERFATRLPTASEQEPDESERFWEAQHEKRGAPAEPPPAAPPPEEPPPAPVPRAPEKPVPSEIAPDASAEDQEVSKAEKDVALEMSAILEKPFSQQRKALKHVRLRWHPDKNPDRVEVATRVFQFIQAHDEWLAYHELS